MRRVRDGQSILDDVRGQVNTINNNVSHVDRQRLDLYLSSVREAEQRLQQDEPWGNTPKPQVNVPAPTSDFGGAQLVQRSRQWYDIVHLALQTDSTRVISLWLSSRKRPEIEGVDLAHHDASHHGQDPAKLEQLAMIEEAELKSLGEFLDKMKQSTEGEHTARPHRDLLRQQPGQLLVARQQQPADHPGRRRFQAPGPRRLRPQEQHAAIQPVRPHDAPDGHRGQVVRGEHGRRQRRLILKGMDTLLSNPNVEFRELCLAKAHELNMAIVAMKVMGAYILGHNAKNVVPDYDRTTLDKLPGAAICWVLQDERVSMLNIGISVPEDIDRNVKLLKSNLTFTKTIACCSPTSPAGPMSPRR